MFVAADSPLPDNAAPAEFCIFGSGPAGMTLALKLAERGRRVVLVEAGGLEFGEWSQDHYKGTVIGDRYHDLSHARLRMFGGTSNHWAGHCIPLEAEDYLPRPFAAHTGWPISIEDVGPYLSEACGILEIPDDFEQQDYAGSVRKTRFQWSPPVLFGEKYHASIAASSNLAVYLETALVGFEREGQRIRAATLRRRSGETFSLRAGQFIMCMGGIENSRMLLWINEQNNRELIPSPDMIGRYWMEHPHAQLGEVLFENLPPGFFHNDEATFALTRARQDQEDLFNAALQVEKYSYSRTKALVADIACVAPALGKRLLHGLGRKLVCGARLHGQWEQAPVPDNRVSLGAERDAFGIPRPELHWRRSDRDRRTIVETVRIFAEDLADFGMGRVRLADWIVHDRAIPSDGMMAIWHHMGGTRMSDDPSAGIVNRDLRVHGLGNLYVAGSSVFPTGGYANPTLMIVQLSLRLADKLSS